MPIYEYVAFAAGGVTSKGIVDADSERDARQKLRKKELLVTKLTETRGGKRRKKGSGNQPGLFVRILEARAAAQGPSTRETELVLGMTRQLATLLGSGIPLTESLSALVEQAEHKRMETMLRQIRESIQQGTSMADALAQHPGWFTEMYINMVSAGQAAGNLDIVLSRLADYMQAQRAMRRKIVGALTYPAMMIVIGMIVVTILMAKVVPEITAMLIEQGKALPPATRVLISVSNVVQNWWWAIIGGFGLISFAVERTYRTSDAGQLWIDRSLLRVPVLGELLRKAAVGRFTRTLSTLLQSGVPVIQSLGITEKVVGNRVISDATATISQRVVEGADISGPLKQSGAFPSVVGYMVAVGEQSGDLEQMLDRIAVAYDEEIDVVTERLTALLEPIMIVLLAGVVGYIVYAIVQPILEIGQI
ncbi:MAG TPA: type II secretion system protein GspF [Planctomycetes bacterium]|nr:type II secretion system protein GspF [Planctomycetota bacterium]